jgi:hypothetical protein
MTTAYCWGSAVFVAFGDVPWTEDDADAFIERVKAIALLEQRRGEAARKPTLPLVLDEPEAAS